MSPLHNASVIATGTEERGTRLVAELTERVSAIEERSGALVPRPRVACLEWLDPLMAAGHWVPELVALAGGELLLGSTGEKAPTVPWEMFCQADPDVIVAQPCGFDLARTRAEMGPLREAPGFGELRAVREGRVVLTDGHHYFNRPGPRLVDSLEILAEILHPDEFDARHRGTAWEPFDA